MNERAQVLDSVHAVETAFSTRSKIVCESPLCDVRFPQSGLSMEPKRYCSGKCRQTASIIRRAAKLLVKLGKEKAWQILTGATVKP